MTLVVDGHAHREEICKSLRAPPPALAQGPSPGPRYPHLVLRPWGGSLGKNPSTYGTHVPWRLLPVTPHGTWLYRPRSTAAEAKAPSHKLTRRASGRAGPAPHPAAQVGSRCRHQRGRAAADPTCAGPPALGRLRPATAANPASACGRAPPAKATLRRVPLGALLAGCLRARTPRPGSRPGSG